MAEQIRPGHWAPKREPSAPLQTTPAPASDMLLVYVAGPFTVLGDRWAQADYIWAAERVGAAIAKLGCVAVVPHTMYRNYEGIRTPQFWYEATRALLLVCHAMVLTYPAQSEPVLKSVGTQGEIDLAGRQMGIPIFEYVADLRDWVTEQKQLRAGLDEVAP